MINPVQVKQKIGGSLFITSIIPVQNSSEIEDSLNRIRKQFFDASHHCYAWRLVNESNGSIQERASDDGEPVNTAGKPILAVLNGLSLLNVMAIITRYFGGTKLGTGGLVKAYTESTQAGLGNATIITKYLYEFFQLDIDYDWYKTFEKLTSNYRIQIGPVTFSDRITVEISILPSEVDLFNAALVNVSNGKYSLM